MPDISMCENNICPLSNSCYRFKAIPNIFRQSYGGFKPNDEQTNCEHYIKATDEEINEGTFYNKVLRFLVDKMDFNTNQNKYILNSGDNSVIMKGELAGYSLGSLKEYIANKQGIQIEWDYE